MIELDPHSQDAIDLATARWRYFFDRDEFSSTVGHGILFATTAIPNLRHTKAEQVEGLVESAENLQKLLFRNDKQVLAFETLTIESIQKVMAHPGIGSVHVFGIGNLEGVLGNDGWHTYRSFAPIDHLKREVIQHVSGTVPQPLAIPFGIFSVIDPQRVKAPYGVELDATRRGEDEIGHMVSVSHLGGLSTASVTDFTYPDCLRALDERPRPLASY